MAMFKPDSTPSKQTETIIGSSVKVEGNFSGEGNVIIEGQLQGTLKTKHNVSIGTGARVKANIEAQDVYLAGEVHGNIKANGKLQVTSSAKLIGNIETSSLAIEPGAILNGKCIMTSETYIPEKIEKVK
ncbi:MAG: polymer-forming cytoskeletal protein [Patescibacteria group bacterium]|jgi:cytoskeletal protein CcmA (bactofilin family)